MKLTVRETKKAIKNNQTVKFTLERNNARELTSNESFQWADEKKENLEKENQKKKKETLESKVDLLLK